MIEPAIGGRFTAMALSRMFADLSPIQRLHQRLRLFICPFEALVAAIPRGARRLDLGCGRGLFLGLLALTGRIGKNCGIDRSEIVIQSAQRMVKSSGWSDLLTFKMGNSV